MKDQLPSPEFEDGEYARPNQNWTCGHSRDGKQCRVGPDSRGHCRAKFECQPVLEVKPGETKGRYRCTRASDQGGPCPSGPTPEGICCRRIIPCQPIRTWRARRGVCVQAFIVLLTGCLALILFGKQRWRFISPGGISSPHASELFHKAAFSAGNAGENCAACHKAARGGPATWVRAAVKSKPLAVQTWFDKSPPVRSKIDQSCQECHAAHGFHQQNVTFAYSCSACHQEHKGSGPMRRVQSENCSFCHGNAKLMPAFRTVHSFEADHPEFKVLRNKIPDPDPLRFSHKTHQASNPRMVQIAGNTLNCAFCHKPTGTGEYYQPVSFARNCQVCHSLQFDKRNPELAVPHGSPEFVRAFFRSLPAQYAEYGSRVKHLQNSTDIEQFVRQELRQLQNQFGSGEELEEKIFFSTDVSGPISDPARLGSQGRSLFPGCAYCHEVQRTGSVPAVSHPVQPAHWLNRGKFDHARHVNFQCAECHNVSGSNQAADVLVPSQKVCATCHRPQGGARNDCAACHWYHNDEKTGLRVIGPPRN
jgi:hypothetical protein